ncbi:CorA family divalent cation transporter [Streptomyces sp. NPDC001435]|uniref:CorA family divalent cation transporter n=1 Tax=unclassified Streptomyces TaxID=2593676 RepID=UPI0036976303
MWLDLYRPDRAEFTAAGEELGLHEPALEDALHEGQRSKLDNYRTHHFLSVHAVAVDPDGAGPTMSELAVILTPQALITVRKDAAFALDELVARWDRTPALAAHGVAFLLHGLLDHVVDGHFAEGGRQIQTVQRQSYALRKSLVYDHVLRAGEWTESLRDAFRHWDWL